MPISSPAKAVAAVGRIRGNRMSASDWYRYIGQIATGDRDPVTLSRAQVKDEGAHQSAASAGSRVFSRLLMQGNKKMGTLFAFPQERLRDLCPIIEIRPKTVSLAEKCLKQDRNNSRYAWIWYSRDYADDHDPFVKPIIPARGR